MMFNTMAAPCHKMANETKCRVPCVCRGKVLPGLMYFQVNWKGQLVLPANHNRPRGQKKRLSSGASGTHSCLQQGRTSAGNWRHGTCHFLSCIPVVPILCLWILYTPGSKTLEVDLGSLQVFSARGSCFLAAM